MAQAAKQSRSGESNMAGRFEAMTIRDKQATFRNMHAVNGNSIPVFVTYYLHTYSVHVGRNNVAATLIKRSIGNFAPLPQGRAVNFNDVCLAFRFVVQYMPNLVGYEVESLSDMTTFKIKVELYHDAPPESFLDDGRFPS